MKQSERFPSAATRQAEPTFIAEASPADRTSRFGSASGRSDRRGLAGWCGSQGPATLEWRAGGLSTPEGQPRCLPVPEGWTK